MALSGTLDTFALPDVLRLLASTEKSGRLRISGTRGSGSVWVDGGDVVASELSTISSLNPSAQDVVFGLLRFENGSFTFEADATAPTPDVPMAMDPILAGAEHMLIEWRSIEEVVPSLDVWVALRPELDGPDVMVDAMRWRAIAAVGSGVQVGVIAETLDLNEVDSCRLAKELIELGLLEKIDAPIAAPAPMPEPVMEEPEPEPEPEPVMEEPEVEPEPEPEPVMEEPESELEPVAATHEPETFFADEEPAADIAPNTVPSLAALDPSTNGTEPVSADNGAGMFGQAGPADAAADDLNPAEMARQLANLSPKAAKAVAAAAKASTEAERDAALAAVEAEDGSVNRGLLLKFLGSVDS